MDQSHALCDTTEVLRRNSKGAIGDSSEALNISIWMWCEKARPVRGRYLFTRRYAQRANSSRERGYMKLRRIGPGRGMEGGETECWSRVRSYLSGIFNSRGVYACLVTKKNSESLYLLFFRPIGIVEGWFWMVGW